jgi:kinesin family member C2/C3
MEGEPTPEGRGVYFRALEDLFSTIQARRSEWSYSLKVRHAASPPEVCPSEGLLPSSLLPQASMVEIYNEVIVDLLDPKTATAEYAAMLEHETSGGKDKDSKAITVSDSHGVVTVNGLTVRPVSSQAEVEAIMAQGAHNRSVSSTLSNERSSRSHSILVVDILGVSAVDPDGIAKTKGRLVLVDLACVPPGGGTSLLVSSAET